MIQKLFSEKILQEILVCPDCRNRLVLNSAEESLRCSGCGSEFPIVEGIPVFMRNGSHLQEEERRFRDEAARQQLNGASRDLLEMAGRYHCFPIMARRARAFRERFSKQEWLLDIGTGYAWPWKDAPQGARIIAIDLSLGNLLLAKRLLGESDSVLLLCADAAHLPLADGTISGVWSAQTFLHFPERILKQAQEELDRVLKNDFLLELYHLNPAALYRFLWWIRGKKLHCRGREGHFETNRLSLDEWLSRWSFFRSGQFKVASGYSELFFHPELGFRLQPYPAGLERLLASRTPALAGWFARQGYLRLENRREEKINGMETPLT